MGGICLGGGLAAPLTCHFQPVGPSTRLSFPLQATIGRIDHLALAINYVGVPLVFSAQGFLVQKESSKQDVIMHNYIYLFF